MIKNFLKKRVIVTRPEPQNFELTQLLNQTGFQAVSFPTIEIAAYESDFDFNTLPTYDYMIFTSINAVYYAHKRLQSYLKQRKTRPQVLAIGKGTQAALKKHHLPIDRIPTAQNFSSETLLKLPIFDNCRNKTFLIITGFQGRRYLADAIYERGGICDHYECYVRKMPNYPSSAIMDIMHKSIDYLVCTSNQCLENFCKIIKSCAEVNFDRSQLIGFSERIMEPAKAYGFKKIPVIATGQSNESIVLALKKLEGMDYDR